MKQFIVDKGWNNYNEQLASIADKEVLIGILAEDAEKLAETLDGDPGDITLYQKAKSVEFGEGQPKRPFMRVSFEKDESRILDLVKKLDEQLLAQSITGVQMLDMIGQSHTDTIKNTMKNGRENFQLNSKGWAKQKGLPQIKDATPEQVTPTVYTGQTRQAINFKVK